MKVSVFLTSTLGDSEAKYRNHSLPQGEEIKFNPLRHIRNSRTLKLKSSLAYLISALLSHRHDMN